MRPLERREKLDLWRFRVSARRPISPRLRLRRPRSNAQGRRGRLAQRADVPRTAPTRVEDPLALLLPRDGPRARRPELDDDERLDESVWRWPRESWRCTDRPLAAAFTVRLAPVPDVTIGSWRTPPSSRSDRVSRRRVSRRRDADRGAEADSRRGGVASSPAGANERASESRRIAGSGWSACSRGGASACVGELRLERRDGVELAHSED